MGTLIQLSQQFVQFNDGSILQASILNTTHILIEAEVPHNHMLAIGFGSYMENSDMVMFQSKSMGMESACTDLWSTGRKKPSIDSQQDYQTQMKFDQFGRTYFRSVRLLDTQDSNGQDYVIKYEDIHEINMIWAFIDKSAELQRHYMDNKGRMKMRCLPLKSNSLDGKIPCMIDGFFWTWHVILGFVIMAYVTVLSLYGFFVWWYSNKSEWHSKNIENVKRVHRYGGYFLLFISQVAMISGVFEYNHMNPSALRSLLGILDIILFFGALSILEYFFRRFRESYVPYEESKLEMGSYEFYQRINESGEKLVILNDMVLNVSKYMFNHPGGKFVIAQNVGRDITKFFYGGYQMENYGNQKPYFHSNVARAVVNQLIIGKLNIKAPKFIIQAVGKYPLNSSTTCFVFRSHTKVPGISKYYGDIQMIGKHYLISSLDQFVIRRQYTITNCLQGDTYQCYLKAIKLCLSDQQNTSNTFRQRVTQGLPITQNLESLFTPNNRNEADDDDGTGPRDMNEMQEKYTSGLNQPDNNNDNETSIAFDAQNMSQMYLDSHQDLLNSYSSGKEGTEVIMTIKNYNTEGGLSKRIFDDTQGNKNVILTCQGPMGIGLDIKRSGTHIAFTGGTGCLVFIDLVAHLIRKSLGMLKTVEDNYLDNENFKFVLYVSFPKREEVIGLELYQGLVDIQEKLGFKNFEFHMRLSNETKQRWDFKFLEEQIQKYHQANIIKKIWVCGPPRMNEDFDKGLAKLSKKFEFEPHTYDVL
eukprot:403341168